MNHVADVLNPQPYTVSADDPLRKVVDIALERRIRSLPVTDASGRYIGVVSLHALLALLLPQAARVEHGVADLAFMAPTVEELREVVRGAGSARVGDHMDEGVAPVHPGTSILEAALLMHRTRENLPVVDRESGRLVGLMSPWEILKQLV